MIKYYKVSVERGHTGRKHYRLDCCFFVKAGNMVEAMDFAKNMPGMKHGRCPMFAKEITAAEYFEGRKVNAYVKSGAKCR